MPVRQLMDVSTQGSRGLLQLMAKGLLLKAVGNRRISRIQMRGCGYCWRHHTNQPKSCQNNI